MKEQFYINIHRTIIIITGTIVLVVLLSSILISKYLSRKIVNQIEEMSEELSGLKELEIGEKNPSRSRGLGDRMDVLTKQVSLLLKETNSINAFIAHEQKNSLALLKGKLQVRNELDLVGLVNTMSASLDDILALNAPNEARIEEVVDAALLCAQAFDNYRKE